jgi:hypothetical protein
MAELTRRYIVMQMATEAPFDLQDLDAPFVLKPWKDPAALKALAAYRDHCYPELAAELSAWIAAIGAGPAPRGDVGARNEAHLGRLASAPAPRSAASALRRRKRVSATRARRTPKRLGAPRSKRRRRP